MTSVAYMVDRLAHDEARTASSTSHVRAAVARRIGVPVGTVENIQRNRFKFVERVEAKVRAAFIRLLESEIAKATHELQIARLASDRMDSTAVIAAETALAEAKKIIASAR